MPQSLSKVYIHIIFSTKHRNAFIQKETEPDLYDYLGGICKRIDCPPVQIGGHENHIHILCLLSRKIRQSELVQRLKQQSSKWIKTKGAGYKDFYWQDGYGVFSVNPSETNVVTEYIRNQHIHHRKRTFKHEYRAFLEKYDVDYDERYVWD